jgi:NADH dehydrogenase [ubiquinone] 1 alpha subcomplex assembly factor 7
MNESPLETEIRRLISMAGPMPVAQYMALCLSHPVHGYYIKRDPLGAAGDFTTAPEVSQMFGELLGVWAAAVWQLMGSPNPVRLVELGPGRGTMMRDMLRAAKVMPELRAAVSVHLVEISELLQRRQRETLAETDVPAQWYAALDELPDGPAIVIANEFFDALPVHQMVKQKDGWHERVVGLGDDGKLTFGLAPYPVPHFDQLIDRKVRAAAIGAVYEWRPESLGLGLARRVVRGNGAALVIDYGHLESSPGDTLQAIGNHSFADPLATPGEIDLTAHVDFQALARSAESMEARVHGPVSQGDFLRRIGIEERAATLKTNATETQAAAIDTALDRLTEGGRAGMGDLFKVVAFSHPDLRNLPGFET